MQAAYNVGMGQVLVEPGEPDRNMERAVRMIREAASRNCRIVVLPECMDIGWTCPDARHLAEPIPGPRSMQLANAARDAGIYVVAGLVERADGRLYNAAVLISPERGILARHRKINELDIALDLYSTGESLAVTRTPAGLIGVDICADNFPDSLVLGHALARMGAQILLSPSAWAVDAHNDNQRQPYGDLWLRSYTELARLHEITVIGVSNVGWLTDGPWKGRKCIGCSLAVGPEGVVLAQGPYGEDAEALITVPVELRERRVYSR